MEVAPSVLLSWTPPFSLCCPIKLTPLRCLLLQEPRRGGVGSGHSNHALAWNVAMPTPGAPLTTPATTIRPTPPASRASWGPKWQQAGGGGPGWAHMSLKQWAAETTQRARSRKPPQ